MVLSQSTFIYEAKMESTKFELWNEIKAVEEAIILLKRTIDWKREVLRRMQQWWFSNDVFLNVKLQDYIVEFWWNCLWYLWYERTKKLDKIVEKNRPYSKTDLALWLCSSLWSRFVNLDITGATLMKELRDSAKEFIEN